MMYLKGCMRLSCALFKEALRENDFGFIDSPMGQLALSMLDNGDSVLAAFRRAENTHEARRKTRRRSARTAALPPYLRRKQKP